MHDRGFPAHPVYLVRHGRTALNAEARFQGRRDEPLDEIGLEQAKSLAEKLHATVPPELHDQVQFHCSPLKRAVMTMDWIARRFTVPTNRIVIENGLIEMGFGTWEGLTSPQVKQVFPEQRRQRKRDRWNFAPENGESHAVLAERLLPWIGSLTAPTIAVTHLGVLRTLAALSGGLDRDDALALTMAADDVLLIADGTLKRC